MKTYDFESDVVLARKISETDTSMIVEIQKSDQNKIDLYEGADFYTMIFVAGKPWEREKK